MQIVSNYDYILKEGEIMNRVQVKAPSNYYVMISDDSRDPVYLERSIFNKLHQLTKKMDEHECYYKDGCFIVKHKCGIITLNGIRFYKEVEITDDGKEITHGIVKEYNTARLG
jgi:hypothetical protein